MAEEPKNRVNELASTRGRVKAQRALGENEERG